MKYKARLNPHITPSQYFIQIEPNLVDFTFTGNEVIYLNIQKKIKSFHLHSVDLKIREAKLVCGSHSYPAKIKYKPKSEVVVLTFPHAFSGKARLYLSFQGAINDQLRGLYRSKYTYKSKEQYLATTQFEATDARRMFPCFDEPSHKAKFILEVIVPKQHTVISNTIEQTVTPHKPGYKIVRFEPTPKMSTYLLALILGDLEHLKTKSKRGVQIRVHTTLGKKQQAKYALEFTKKALDYLEDYFGIPYPMPVLDLIAVPDFSAGAMENWGAITFRETLLLVDEAHSPFTQKQRVAEVIAHELVHQWFGNLVTMEWWTHLWLNESFATYMAYVTVDAIYPGWNFWTKFVLEEQSYALEQDSLHSTHPIEVVVNHPDEIAEIFDAISYAKGASVLRMLSNYLGQDNFRRGLSLYLKKHSYQNTSSIHLWKAFEKVSGLPVRQMMRVWTTKSGFPVITAQLLNNVLYLKQEEFKQLSDNRQGFTLWPVPLLIQTGKNQYLPPMLMKSKTAKLNIESSTEFLNLDYNDSSLTIIHYDKELLARLLPLLQKKKINTLDRLALVRDALLLSKSGKLSSDVYLEIVTFLNNEQSYVVWSEVVRGINQMRRMLAGTKTEQNFEKYVKAIFSKLLQKTEIGLQPKTGESNNNAMLRGVAFAEAGLSGYTPAKNEAMRLFKREKKGKSINPNLRSAVYTIVARYGEMTTYQDLQKLYIASDFPTHKQQLLFGMINGCTKTNQELLLDFIFSDSVRDQDKPFAISAALLNPHIKNYAWRTVKLHWADLLQKYGGSKMMGTLISGCQSFNTKSELKSLQTFLQKGKIPAAKQAISQTIEKVRINLNWQKRDIAAITQYLKDF
jgi:aminopeptidase N